MFKHQFSFFKNNPEQVYLDSAATTQKHDSVIAAVNDYHLHHNATVHRSAYKIATTATQLYEKARDSVAKLIHCENSAQVIFTSGATESLNTIAAGLSADMLHGDTILLLASEHHANILPWQALSKRLGLKIDVVELSSNGEFTTTEFDKIKQQMSNDVAILAMAHVSNALGNIYPVSELCELATQLRILTVLDGTQAIAHIPVNIECLGCDFYVFSGHKMYGPTGTGVLFGKIHLLQQLSPSKLGGEMISKVSFTEVEYQLPPLKFEGGTPNVAGVIGLGAAAEFLITNLVAIQAHEIQCYERLTRGLLEINDIQLMGNIPAFNSAEQQSENVSASIGLHSFVLKEQHEQNLNDLAQVLYQQNIALRVGHHCAMPLMQYLKIRGTMRVSIACYTSAQDIDYFVNALKQTLKQKESIQKESIQEGSVKESNLFAEKLERNADELPIATKLSRVSGWDNQYRQLLLASKLLPILPEAMRVESNAVLGCESELWIAYSNKQLCAYSQSKVIRGILAVLLEQVEQRIATNLLHIPFDYFAYLSQLNLTPFFSAGRRDGIRNAINAIHIAIDAKPPI